MLEDPAFWAIVALIIFFGLLLYLKVPAILASALDGRVDAIRKELDEARRLREEAQALQEVRALSADVAIAAAERILADRVKGETADALVARSIRGVEAKLN